MNSNFSRDFYLTGEQCRIDNRMIIKGHVIEIRGRFFIGIINNRVRTAWRHEGAKVFATKGGAKELHEAIEELHKRGKSPSVRAVGYWLGSIQHWPEKAKAATC